ncbi:MAG: ABC transporter permease [Pseudomonadales bacterium]|nr:ABC transporter permease [Pseudomonadales bacterium]MCP5185986.1 ABC transporter permease [Pseudomonadales bacterium]
MLWNALLLALREIRRNVLRSALTVLGIVIGVAAVIVMVTLGRGATAAVSEQIASLGSNLLMVRPGQGFGPNRASARAFTLADATALAAQAGDLQAVAPAASTRSTAIFGNRNWDTMLTGSTNAYLLTGNWKLADGRTFTDAELRAGRAVCILGATVQRELFAGQSPVGSRIRLKRLNCTVVGLLAAKGQSAMGTDQDDVVLLPIRTFQRRVAGNTDVALLITSVRSPDLTDQAMRDITAVLRQRRHLGAGEEDDFNVFDTRQISETLTGTTRVLTLLLGAVAGVSLLVGGIGIMNIMLVSVTERTREIGIRLAIGALEREVLGQFLVEAVVLSSCGGLVGIALALLAGAAITAAIDIPFVLDVPVVTLAFAFSAAVGVLFGYVPARRAARMDPIEALRHE